MGESEPKLENYTTDTDDGYRLALQRLNGGEKGPVIMCHGLLGNGSEYLLSADESHSLARYVANRGYDVWVVDDRGHRESRGYLIKDHWDDTRGAEGYWKFYVDDLAQHDVPAFISKVREVSGTDKVSWIGRSMGGWLSYAHIIDGSGSNDFKGVVSIACQSYFTTHTTSASGLSPELLAIRQLIDKVFSLSSTKRLQDMLISIVEKLPSSLPTSHVPTNLFLPLMAPLLKRIRSESIKSTQIGSIINTLINFMVLYLYNPDNVSLDIEAEMISKAVSEESWYTVFDWIDYMRNGDVARHDYGKEGNLEHYGSERPPSYWERFEEIDVPVSFFTGAKDMDATIETTTNDYNRLKKAHPDMNVRLHIIPNCGHIDILIGENAHDEVYPLVLEDLESFE